MNSVVKVKRVTDKITSLILGSKCCQCVCNTYWISVRQPIFIQLISGSTLNIVLESVPSGERAGIGTDFNGHVGEINRGVEQVLCSFGVKEINKKVTR